jgi:cytochrome c-type biogenesis protein
MTTITILSTMAFGAALALAYKPCVTPTLTVILNLNNSAETAGAGAVLLLAYTLGTVTVILATGVVLSILSRRISSDLAKVTIKRLCGVVLIIVSFLILSDRMTAYKSFLVGRFVPMATTVGSEGGHH